MKKTLILFSFILSVAFVGCDESIDDFTPVNYVTFESGPLEFSVDKDASASYDVHVYAANVEGADRTFSIAVDESSSLTAESFNVPGSVTIPANSNEATFAVELVDNNLSDSGGVLVLSLAGEGESYLGGSLSINVSKICDFDPVGVYVDSSEFYEADVDVEIVAGSSANVFVAKDLFAAGTDITFTVNADNSISVSKQDAWVSGTYGQAQVEGQDGSKLEPCSGKITLVLEHTVSAGSFGNITETLVK
tara:strand:+ start:107 stop:853 length:747 start_codon:yes stop_codon:yes gene_type:complete